MPFSTLILLNYLILYRPLDKVDYYKAIFEDIDYFNDNLEEVIE